MRKLIMMILVMLMAISCRSTKEVDRHKLNEKIDKTEHVIDSSWVNSKTKQIVHDMNSNKAFNVKITTGTDTVYRDREIIVKDADGNEMRTRLGSGDIIDFGSTLAYESHISLLEYELDSIKAENRKLRERKTTIEKKTEKKVARKTLMPFTIVMLILLCSFVYYKYNRLKKHL